MTQQPHKPEDEELDQRNPQNPAADTEQSAGAEQIPEALDDPIIAQGLAEHGDAFRAYLQRPDIDPEASDLLDDFEDSYIGTYDSVSELAEELTELPAVKAELDRVAARWGFDGLFIVDEEKLRTLADTTWDTIDTGGKLHVFSK